MQKRLRINAKASMCFFVMCRGVRRGACIIPAEGQEGGLRGGFLVFVSVCFCFFCKKVIILQVDKVGSLPI